MKIELGLTRMRVPRRSTTRIKSSDVSKIRWLIACIACCSALPVAPAMGCGAAAPKLLPGGA
jgi:hypothetical protein